MRRHPEAWVSSTAPPGGQPRPASPARDRAPRLPPEPRGPPRASRLESRRASSRRCAAESGEKLSSSRDSRKKRTSESRMSRKRRAESASAFGRRHLHHSSAAHSVVGSRLLAGGARPNAHAPPALRASDMDSPERPSSPRPLAPLHSLSPPRPPRDTFFSWDRTNGEVGPSGAHAPGGFPHSGLKDAHKRGDSRHSSPSVSREGSLRGGERFVGGVGSGHHDRNHLQGHPRVPSPPASRGGSIQGGDRYSAQALPPLHSHSGRRKRSSTLGFVLLLAFVALLAPIVYHHQHHHHIVTRRRRERESVVFRGDVPGDGGDGSAFHGNGDALGMGETSRADERRTGDPIVMPSSGVAGRAR